MKAVCVWLTDRLDLQLHMYQLKTLIKIVKVNQHRDERTRPLALNVIPDGESDGRRRRGDLDGGSETAKRSCSTVLLCLFMVANVRRRSSLT